MLFRNKILSSLLIFLLAGCSTVPLTGRRQLSLVSDAEILSLSAESYNSYMSSAKSSYNTTQNAVVARCGQRIQQAVNNYFQATGNMAQLNGYNWSFALVQDQEANAFCLPGGKVVVYEGILPYTQNETGLAVVLGHEIAHAVAKHSNERISQQLLVQTGGSVLNLFMGLKSPETQSLVATVYGLGSNLGVMLPFSRKQEYEADQLGLIFMAMAGYDPREAVSFWSRMSQGNSSSTPEFMSTHPADNNRIAHIQAILPDIMSRYYKKKSSYTKNLHITIP